MLLGHTNGPHAHFLSLPDQLETDSHVFALLLCFQLFIFHQITINLPCPPPAISLRLTVEICVLMHLPSSYVLASWERRDP
jgi:hypothetical protein